MTLYAIIAVIGSVVFGIAVVMLRMWAGAHQKATDIWIELAREEALRNKQRAAKEKQIAEDLLKEQTDEDLDKSLRDGDF